MGRSFREWYALNLVIEGALIKKIDFIEGLYCEMPLSIFVYSNF